MGIRGLTGFIDNNQHVLHQHQLHDSSVVLDGNNFYHFLYYACNVQSNFGGDYDVYRKTIISTFDSFRKCGITPFVVLDGAYTVDGRKLKTSLSRASSRIKVIAAMGKSQRNQALPPLAYETFIQTMNELGVRHATCQFEADNEIAVLANKLRCPVISNDSDFYIFDLSHGFLPLDYLDFRPLEKQLPHGTKYYYLHCHKYNVDDFINSFDGLNRSVLPVFASLLGNDCINAGSFSTFYSRVKVPKIVSKKFSLPPRLSKVISVLHWLHTQTDSTEFSDIKREILEFVKPRRKTWVEKMFVLSVNGYVDVENFQGFDLFQFFTSGLEKNVFAAAADFHGYNGTPFPDWFIRAVCCGEITPSILNSAILHRVIILTQVEDLSQQSSYLCSQVLRKVIYGVLLHGDCPSSTGGAAIEDMNTMSLDCLVKDKFSSLSFTNTSDISAQLDKWSNTESILLEKQGFPEFPKEVQNSFFTSVLISEVGNKAVNFSEEVEGELLDTKSSECLSEDLCLNNETSHLEKQESPEIPRECENPVFASMSISEEVSNENVDFLDDIKDDEAEDELLDEEIKVCEDCSEGIAAGTGQVNLKKLCVEEYTRINKNLLKTFMDPLFHIGRVSVPTLTSLETLSLEKRRTVLMESFGIDSAFMSKFSSELHLFAACLTMWSRNAAPKISFWHLDTVIIGAILLNVLGSLSARNDELKEGNQLEREGDIEEKNDNELINYKKGLDNAKKEVETVNKNGKIVNEQIELNEIVHHEISSTNLGEYLSNASPNFQEGSSNNKLEERITPEITESEINIALMCSKVDIHVLKSIRQNLNKYRTKCPTFNHKNHYNPKICHSFAQLQSCMLDAINLNKLLRFPFPSICPSNVINGTFLYNFFGELSARANPDQFLAAMLERNAGILLTFKLFKDAIVGCVGEGCFMSQTTLPKKSRKRKSKGKTKDVNSNDTREDNSDEKETTVKTISGFNVTNKFSLLSLDD